MDLRYSQLGTLKSYWKVSKAAIIYRAKSSNGITSDRYTNLNIELSKNGERKKESGFVDISEPKIISLIINTHENELGYSLEEMLKLLGINENDYFEYFNRSAHHVSVKPRKVIDFASYSRKN
jgi:Zn-dependent peptidase ImmA (M78 family)